MIVGDIRDQFDIEEPTASIDRLEDGGYAIDGDVPLATLNDELRTAFESEGIETAGGFVLSRLGRAPTAGDEITAGDYTIRVEAVDGARITELLVTQDRDA
ncbi:MAG: transporter associated domain-containing protein [Halobacteriaceae archaeon]